jgi:hypothetical protein
LIWFDAICINQNDQEEKTHQVRMMKETYENACRVIIWLDRDWTGYLAAPMLLETLAAIIHMNRRAMDVNTLSDFEMNS